MPIRVFAGLIAVALLPARVEADPRFGLAASTASVEKGHSFEILVRVDTDRPLDQLTIAPIAPLNFVVSPRGLPALASIRADSGGAVTVSGLRAGSAITLSFLVRPPSQFRIGVLSDTAQSLDGTRDAKVFAFNFRYVVRDSVRADTAFQTASVSLRYTTSMAIYLIWGLIGVLIGFFIKTVSKRGSEASEKNGAGSVLRLPIRLGVGFPLALTTLAIGFGVLLSLAQDKIPANGWFHAIALGIGIGILSDEQVIAKLTPATDTVRR